MKKRTSISNHPSHRRFFVMSTLALMMLLIVLPHPAAADNLERGMALRKRLAKASGQAVGVYRALIIGINDYEDPNISTLETAVNDAKVLANILKREYGFSDITLLIDETTPATATRIIKSIRSLITRSKEEDSVLIYYGGHGDLDNLTKKGWWIPQNARAGDPSTYLSNSVIQDYVEAIQARHLLLVVDSCFSGSLFGHKKMRVMPPIIDDNWYESMFSKKSRWGLTSGNLTPVSDEGHGGHSIFAYNFLEALKGNKKPYMTPREIFQEIAPTIGLNSEQIPINEPIKNTGHQGGEFIFIRTGANLLPGGREEASGSQTRIKQLEAQVKLEDQQQMAALVPQVLKGGQGMVFVKGGCYQMGDIFGDGESNEKPVHEVCVDDFYMGKYEVQVSEFQKFVNDTRYKTELEQGKGCVTLNREYETDKNWREPGYSQRGNHPVVCVSWNDAQAYIAWKNREDVESYRLPTEAEWEYAARSGGKRYKYSSGNTYAGNIADEQTKRKYSGWTVAEGYDDGYIFTSPVGSFQANELNLHDMTGNVREWVSDLYQSDYYKFSPRSNPQGVFSEFIEPKVFRGGSWDGELGSVRVAYRQRAEPSVRAWSLGFRLVRLLKKEEPQKEIKSVDGRYIARNGTVIDTKIGLMWTQKDSQADLGTCLNWDASKAYVNNLNTGGHRDWRMPTISELKGIYEKSKMDTVDLFGEVIHIDSIFLDRGASLYWASRTVITWLDRDRVLDFVTGEVRRRNLYFKSDGNCQDEGVRAVR